MRMLVTDTGGQVGNELCRIITEHGIEHQKIRLKQINIADVCAADSYSTEYWPDAGIHDLVYIDVNQDDFKKVRCIAAHEGGIWNGRTMRKTNTADLSSLLCEMMTTKKYAAYHDTDESGCSLVKYFWKLLCQTERKTVSNSIPVHEYSTSAARFRLSKASLDDAGFARWLGWHGALRRYVKGELL